MRVYAGERVFQCNYAPLISVVAGFVAEQPAPQAFSSATEPSGSVLALHWTWSRNLLHRGCVTIRVRLQAGELVPVMPNAMPMTTGIATWLAFYVLGGTVVSGAVASLRVDRVVIEKHNHRLTLYMASKPIKVYKVALGSEVGRKRCQGDRRTPEGLYVVDSRIEHSGFHRALHLSYPNRADEAAAAQAGCPAGGAIMIHGAKNGLGWLGRLHRLTDWTAGCIAVTDDEIEEIWKAVPNGTVVEIRA